MAPWTVAYQAPLSMGFSRKEYRSGFPFPCPGDLPDPGIEPGSPALQADSVPSEPPGRPRKPTKGNDSTLQLRGREKMLKHVSIKDKRTDLCSRTWKDALDVL